MTRWAQAVFGSMACNAQTLPKGPPGTSLLAHMAAQVVRVTRERNASCGRGQRASRASIHASPGERWRDGGPCSGTRAAAAAGWRWRRQQWRLQLQAARSLHPVRQHNQCKHRRPVRSSTVRQAAGSKFERAETPTCASLAISNQLHSPCSLEQAECDALAHREPRTPVHGSMGASRAAGRSILRTACR